MAAERRVGTLLLWGLALILMAALTIWFLENFELRTKEVDAGLAAEARKNRFLAAERFLQRLNIMVESVAGRELLRTLPPNEDMLVVKGLGALNAQRREALHAWLEAGGRLLVAPTELWEWEEGDNALRQDFLNDYGVQLHKLEDGESQQRVVATVAFEGYPEALELELDGRYQLVDALEEADGGVSVDDRYRLLQYDIGDGQLTVTSDMSPFTNAWIGKRDHALFLALLAETSAGGKVWLLYDNDVPWLGALLWRHAPHALIAAACLILALLWHLGGRLGPLLPSPRTDRRDLLAHLQALADFHWRHGRGSHLTRVTRERVEQAWLRRHPSLRGMKPDERAEWIAQRTGLSVAKIQRILYPPHIEERSLLEQARLLQRLWTASGQGRARR